MRRLSHWPRMLHDELTRKSSEPFVWGVNDCCLFVADCILAMTGNDLAEGYRGNYNSLASAVNLLQERFGGSVERMAEQCALSHGFEEVALGMAQRGDVVLYQGSLLPDAVEWPALGVVSLDGIHGAFLTQQGLEFVPVRSCRRAWKV